jgi:hypothetical protein
MNGKLKDSIGRIETWPPAAQEEAVQSLLAIEQEIAKPHELTDEDRAAIDRSLEDTRPICIGRTGRGGVSSRS